MNEWIILLYLKLIPVVYLKIEFQEMSDILHIKLFDCNKLIYRNYERKTLNYYELYERAISILEHTLGSSPQQFFPI